MVPASVCVVGVVGITRVAVRAAFAVAGAPGASGIDVVVAGADDDDAGEGTAAETVGDGGAVGAVFVVGGIVAPVLTGAEVMAADGLVPPVGATPV